MLVACASLFVLVVDIYGLGREGGSVDWAVSCLHCDRYCACVQSAQAEPDQEDDLFVGVF